MFAKDGNVNLSRSSLIAGLCLLLSACDEHPAVNSYRAKLAEVQADCTARGGDEVEKHGQVYISPRIVDWQPQASFRCVRLERDKKLHLAVYMLRREGGHVTIEVRL